MLKIITKGVTLGFILVLAPIKKSEELVASRKNVHKRGKEVKHSGLRQQTGYAGWRKAVKLKPMTSKISKQITQSTNLILNQMVKHSLTPTSSLH